MAKIKEVSASVRPAMPTISVGDTETPRHFHELSCEFIGAASCVDPANHALANAFMCGHALELGLKSYLRLQGVSLDDLANQRKFGHNLVKLWESSAGYGLALAAPMPQWVSSLNSIFQTLQVRYGISQKRSPGQSCMVIPGAMNLRKDVLTVIHTVTAALFDP